MNRTRRSFLGAVLTAPFFVRAAAAAQGQWPRTSQRRPRLPEEIPENQAAPPEAPKPNPQLVLKHNGEQIKKDVERLFELASQLRKEIAATDSSAILSLKLVNKAEEIEKLARQIKNLARG